MEKIIHQTWKSTELTVEQLEFVSSVKQAFQGFEYKFWQDEDNRRLISESYSQFLGFYNTLNSVEKADFVRHLYIYHYGGVYLDIDVKMNRPLELNGADVFLCDQTKEANTEKMEFLVDPFFLAGSKDSPFFYSFCETVARGNLYKILSTGTKKEYFETLYKTGPFILSKFYLLNKHKYDIKILTDVFTTKNFVCDKPKDEFYGIHYQMNSWLREEDRRP